MSAARASFSGMITCFYDWPAATGCLAHKVKLAEPIFVVDIMTYACKAKYHIALISLSLDSTDRGLSGIVGKLRVFC